jgi:hypothetical protein
LKSTTDAPHEEVHRRVWWKGLHDGWLVARIVVGRQIGAWLCSAPCPSSASRGTAPPPSPSSPEHGTITPAARRAGPAARRSIADIGDRLPICRPAAYCRDLVCPRSTFAERFPKLLARHAQRTRHLARAHAKTGLGLGGLPAARLLVHLATPTSATTLLRMTRELPPLSTPRPCVVEWALRKGRTYATIVLDLEWRRPLDLLPLIQN